MSIPLNKLIDYQGNIYELTSAAIKEANILSQPGCGGKEIEEKNEKIVSVVLTEALDGKIVYTKPDESKEEK